MATVEPLQASRFSAHSPAQQAPVSDDLHDLFNYDADFDNDLHNTDPSGRRNDAQSRPQQNDGLDPIGLGIDEEIKVRKPRKPQPKLDEDRLLSDKGIPKLRKITKERLKFKGKGHEFSDVARLLNTYQLWLDDLFPKAKFADGLAIIEKLGHKKRLQVMRKTWIDEEKPTHARDDLSDVDGDFIVHDPHAHADEDAMDEGYRDEAATRDDEGGMHRSGQDSDHEELYRHSTPNPALPADAGEPDEDELDALLAEDATRGIDPNHATRDVQAADKDDFADDEEAMADMW